MNQRTKSILLLLLTGLLWSVGGVFIKANDANPFVISSVRGLVAAIVFFLALKGRPRMTWSKPQVVGALAYSGVLTTFVLATVLTSAANAILLEYTSPIFVAILAWLILRERLHGYDILAIIGVGVGMWLLMSGNLSGGHMAGNVIGVGTGICYAVFVICLRLQKDASPYETVFLGNIFTFLIGLPFFFLAPPALTSVLPVIFLGVFQIAIPYLILTYASKNAKAIDITLFTILEPLLNPVWVFLYTGEDPGLRTIIGGAVLLAVVVMKSLVVLKPKRGDAGTIHVAAAILLKGGHILATQRGYGNYAGYWEFPGGKIEPPETPEDALLREIEEELRAEITVDSHLIDVEYDYPEFHLKMACYLCSLKSEISLREHSAAKWLSKENLYSVDWLGADIEVLKALEVIL